MSSYAFAPDDVAPLLEGLAILGTGGGGSPSWGQAILEHDFSMGRTPSIIPLQDIDDNATVVSGGMMGSVKVLEDMGIDRVVPARETVSIPVLGPAESSMHVAAMLANRFSVVTILDGLIPAFENHALKLGLSEQLASVRAVSMRGADLDNQERLQAAIEEQAAKAVEEDGAHSIVLGCTAMRGLAMDVEEGLRKRGITGVPVIDPALLALKLAEAFVDMGLSHSKLTYPEPPQQ